MKNSKIQSENSLQATCIESQKVEIFSANDSEIFRGDSWLRILQRYHLVLQKFFNLISLAQN